MKHIKRNLTLALALLTSSTFVGCGGGSSSPTVGTTGSFEFTSSNSASLFTGATRALDVDAVDPDGGSVSYTISGADVDKFAIDATGVLLFKAEATAGTYHVSVTALAGGKSISQNITITVTVPVNHAPIITSSNTASVNENQTSAMTVTATDADADTLTFSISGGADADKVSINPNDGVVTFNTAPDFESKNSYAFTVGANDGVETTTNTVTITILDVAEGSAPVITTANAISVNENQKGAVDVDATDVDGDTITYTFEGGADDVSFDINATTGIVTFKIAPDYETKNSYSIIVGASDATDTTTKNIVIAIKDLVGGSKVVKTGQSISYTANDDGAYQSGLDRSFTRSTDIWNVLKDNATKLQWKDNSYVAYKNYSEASGYCNNLNWQSKTDWRLPTITELYTIANREADNPAIFSEFQNTNSDKRYWSSTKFKRSSNTHYTLGFDLGNDYRAPDSQKRYVRCVRKDFVFFPWFIKRFTRANNIVSDKNTNLQWWDPATFNITGLIPHIVFNYVGEAAKTGTFTQAISSCENLTADGKSDWRLPNINELLTIVNTYKSTGVAFYDDFKSNTTGLYFSSTTNHNETSKAWMVHFGEGQDSLVGGGKNSTNKYRCVRTMGD